VSLAQTGAVVTTGNVPSFPVLQTLNEPLRARIESNIAKGNIIIQRLAEEYQVILIDAWTICSRFNLGDWSEDKIHLNSRGYFKFAKEILKTIEQHVGIKIGDIETP
jgi:lysophospholipase L1-like esterase